MTKDELIAALQALDCPGDAQVTTLEADDSDEDYYFPVVKVRYESISNEVRLE